MSELVPLKVQMVAATEFTAPPDIPWSTDADGGEALVEFAGRACYESWDKPNLSSLEVYAKTQKPASAKAPKS